MPSFWRLCINNNALVRDLYTQRGPKWSAGACPTATSFSTRFIKQDKPHPSSLKWSMILQTLPEYDSQPSSWDELDIPTSIRSFLALPWAQSSERGWSGWGFSSLLCFKDCWGLSSCCSVRPGCPTPSRVVCTCPRTGCGTHRPPNSGL